MRAGLRGDPRPADESAVASPRGGVGEGAPAVAADGLPEAVREPLAELLLALADDEFVIGFMDSEWTGIAPLLEEDVAMSSLAQDELGHARALYQLLGDLTGRDPDEIAYDRPPEAFRHARLLDGGRGDWAATIARRFLYDTADSVRLEALRGSSWRPLADLAAKIRREESYHLLHAGTWLRRLSRGGDDARRRLIDALAALAPEAWTVLAALPGEPVLLSAGMLPEPSSALDASWRERIEPILFAESLPIPAPAAGGPAREGHTAPFRWLHRELTSVRRLEPGATW